MAQHVILERVAAITAEWAPTAGRILLGVVFAWFGYHELLNPGQWTQYVPVISESSSLAMILVLAHGWILLSAGRRPGGGDRAADRGRDRERGDAGDRHRADSYRLVRTRPCAMSAYSAWPYA